MFKFRLYIVGEAPNSVQAISNLDAICREHLPDRHHIEIIDVLLHPKLALDEGILLTPTLVRFVPEPIRRIVGTLSDKPPVLKVLGIPAVTP
jgi:circadian clock protein KaiB